MEDEDGESKIIDMWNILEEQQLKDSTLSNALRHSIDDVYANVIEDEKQLIAYNSIRKESSGKNTVAGPKLPTVGFKGFKKRILAQAREVHPAASRNSAPESQQSTLNPNAHGGRERRAEKKRERKIAEYTQYLGLQPSARNKCSRCHARSDCDPNLKQQSSCTCNSSMTPMPSTSESSASLSHASNFKRKVYLCSACRMYYENWNMFLHMREIHKRHICLFCLGMFGHADRLLHHLVKKHNVPEIAFTTAGDFHNCFKGSCYLVCCDCEKVFSETDDFFSHYCSSTLTQETTDTGTSVCTICRQTGTHASTCNFALLSDTDRESYSAAAPLTIADATRADNASPAAVPLPEKTNFGGKGLPRKGKYARNRHGGNSVQNSRSQKLNALTRKLDAKTRCNETQPECDHDVQKEIANSLARDTVTETIMEVSRYTGGDSSDENDENDEQAVNKDVYNSRDRGLDEKSPIQNCQLDRSEPYDSVTETIMEVSRYTGEENRIERREDSTCIPDTLASHHEKMDIEEEDTCDKSNIDSARSVSSRVPSPVRETEEITLADTKANPTCESGIESGFRSYSSPQDVRSPSPVNRSLFSPQHESHVSKEEEEEEEEEEDKEQIEMKKEDKPNATAESQATFSAVASSDRSLVIKICNRNSQFSVATATTASREPEESNTERSKEKISNGANKERNIGDQTNELDDSDSDSDKLAVVDSNPEEDEEMDDGEDAEEADEEPENNRDDAGDGNRENQEGNNDNFGTGIDGFALTEATPSGDVGEKFSNNEIEGPQAESVANDQAKSQTIGDDGIALAGEDVPFIDLNVEGTLDSMELEELLKRCIEAASPFCVYCNHARYIAVNGKQLSLHMLAEHKFQPQHPAIIIHAEQFIARVKRSLEEFESRHFNLNTYDSMNGTYNVPSVLIYECFHCRFHSTVHKELYLHNRKMHQKTILKCIMCKSTFYSYSELVCHLCPGVYSPNVNLRYRCCLCSTDSLPSTFRLMVHLRKRHHTCDVCLESTGNQQRLSNHVWKHKLHHLCYRCGIAYRNKPDITKHLFWKHGTESVLCRKCLQKKWPHIYHFCIPPTAFVCEECGSSFSRAVALKVHKRLHSGDSPYNCEECTQRFISRKLLAKHQAAHKEPEPEDVYVNVTDAMNDPSADKDEKSAEKDATTAIDNAAATGVAVEAASKNVKEAVKRVVDVYDLPPLNLSSESDTDNEEEKVVAAEKPEKEKIDEEMTEKKSEVVEETVAAVVPADDDDVAALTNDIVEVERNEEEKKQEARIMDGIWDNFKTYAASLDVEESAKNVALKESVPETDAAYLRSIVLADHDYHVVYSDKEKSEDVATAKDDDGAEQRRDVKPERTPSPSSPSRNVDSDANKRKTKTPKKKKRSGSASSTSDSSSDSDSSSCSCGTNCSCSSSSSGSSSSSSSSSDSDSSTSESSPRKQSSGRKDRSKKEKEVARENKSQSVEPENKPEDNKPEITLENGPAVPEVTIESPTPPPKLSLRESDLETEETETDEDFYDEHPQLLANKLAEKRNQLQLLAAVAPASTPTSLPSMEQPSTPLNNGALDVETTLPEMTVVDQQPQQSQQQKRKAKTKKRRKGERANKRSNATNATVESIKLNIPKAFYSQKNPGFAVSSPAALHPNSRSSTPNLMPAAACNDFHSSGDTSVTMEMMQQQIPLVAAATPVTGASNPNIGGGSETENKRVSKRKRVPKRFYGDSSDDEPQEKQPAFGRWRKVETTPSTPVFTPSPSTASPLSISKPTIAPTKLSFGVKTITTSYNRQHAQVEQAVGQQATLPEALPIAAPASATESEDPAGSSSDSSESETEETGGQPMSGHNAASIPPAVNASTAERTKTVYCYCRCPYDEVSEMIACDGEDCRIEWFHFECVGIIMPPKGKWYCPDCRKKHGIVQNNDYCD